MPAKNSPKTRNITVLHVAQVTLNVLSVGFEGEESSAKQLRAISITIDFIITDYKDLSLVTMSTYV